MVTQEDALHNIQEPGGDREVALRIAPPPQLRRSIPKWPHHVNRRVYTVGYLLRPKLLFLPANFADPRNHAVVEERGLTNGIMLQMYGADALRNEGSLAKCQKWLRNAFCVLN